MQNQWAAAFQHITPLSIGLIILFSVMSIITITVAIIVVRDLRARGKATRAFADRFTTALQRDDVAGAIAQCRAHARSHVAQVLGAALTAARPFLSSPGRAEYAGTVADVAAEREQTMLSTQLRGHLTPLAAIGATATLLGLLGTVIGIMNAFGGMAQAGGGSIDAIAGGISEALVGTALGLLVAIPAVWLYTWIGGRFEKLFAELDFAVQELQEWILTHGEPEVRAARAAADTSASAASGVTVPERPLRSTLEPAHGVALETT